MQLICWQPWHIKHALGLRIAITALGCINQAIAADNGTLNPEDFTINELMQMEVSSASRKAQSLSDTAAAAFIISQEDIRRSGATSIPEALRLAPGIDVARINSSSWAITARGFNGRYANKLLVLMDGRTLYTPLFSGVFWNLQDTLLEDIERIEVIRGPGAVMWGANAVNGVINIISKKAKDTQDNLIVAGGGNQEKGFAGYGTAVSLAMMVIIDSMPKPSSATVLTMPAGKACRIIGARYRPAFASTTVFPTIIVTRCKAMSTANRWVTPCYP